MFYGKKRGFSSLDGQESQGNKYPCTRKPSEERSPKYEKECAGYLSGISGVYRYVYFRIVFGVDWFLSQL